jgi:hypothetical protein
MGNGERLQSRMRLASVRRIGGSPSLISQGLRGASCAGVQSVIPTEVQIPIRQMLANALSCGRCSWGESMTISHFDQMSQSFRCERAE